MDKISLQAVLYFPQSLFPFMFKELYKLMQSRTFWLGFDRLCEGGELLDRILAK